MSSSIQPDMFTDPVALSTRGKTCKPPSQTAVPSSSTTSTPSTSISFVKPRPKASSSNMTRYSPRSRARQSTGRKNRKNTSGRTCRLCGCGPFSKASDCLRHMRKSCELNPDKDPLVCKKCGTGCSRPDALRRHMSESCRGYISRRNGLKSGRRVTKQAPVVVDECDGDEDSIREEEDEVSGDEMDYDPADGEYVDDGESMGDDESYDDECAEEESEHAVAGHAEGSEDPEADDAEQDHDDEYDFGEDIVIGSQSGGELDAVRDSFAASALLDLSNGVRSSSKATSYSPTPTAIANSSSSEDGTPAVPATRALDTVFESSKTGAASEVLSSMPTANPLQPASEAPSNSSPMVQVTPYAYYSYPPPFPPSAAGPVDVGGEVGGGQNIDDNGTVQDQQTPTSTSTPQSESDLAELEVRRALYLGWGWSPAAFDSDSDAEDY